MPGHVTLRIRTNKAGSMYQVGPKAGYILQMGGWTVAKRTRSYWYVRPPEGEPGGSAIDVVLAVPTDDEIIATANDLREHSEPKTPMMQTIHRWPAIYYPDHTVTTTIQEFDGLGLNGPDWTLPPPAVSQHHEKARCEVGLPGIWQVTLEWADDGRPRLSKYPTLEVTQDQLPLFELNPTPAANVFPEPQTNPDEVLAGTYIEGAVRQVLVNAYERDERARDACIAKYGAICCACGLDFEQRYGEIGRGFIHVHHLKPLSEIAKEYVVDPIRDLRPVCPNCHAMLHQGVPTFSIDELKAMLRG